GDLRPRRDGAHLLHPGRWDQGQLSALAHPCDAERPGRCRTRSEGVCLARLLTAADRRRGHEKVPRAAGRLHARGCCAGRYAVSDSAPGGRTARARATQTGTARARATQARATPARAARAGSTKAGTAGTGAGTRTRGTYGNHDWSERSVPSVPLTESWMDEGDCLLAPGRTPLRGQAHHLQHLD